MGTLPIAFLRCAMAVLSLVVAHLFSGSSMNLTNLFAAVMLSFTLPVAAAPVTAVDPDLTAEGRSLL